MKYPLLAISILLGLSQSVVANQLIVDTNRFTANYATGFGNPFVTNLGQTFTAPRRGTNLTLDSFGFYLRGPATESMIGYLYAWDGTAATGPALFKSPVQSLLGTGGFDLIEFDTGGVSLDTGKEYICILSTAEVPDSVGQCTAKYLPPSRALGGNFYFQQSGADFSRIFASSWMATSWGTAFRASFSGTGIQFIPEPSALVLFGLGLGTVLAVRIRLHFGRAVSS